jgi:L-fuculose-phosphate aldolase
VRLADLRERVVITARKMVEERLVQSTAGNVSALDRASSTIAITPASIEYDSMHAADIVLIDLEGRVVDGVHAPSSETPMHCAVYKHRADVGAIVHTHSPWATTFAVLGREIPPVHYVISSIGDRVRVAPYTTYGTEELGRYALQTLGMDNAILLQNHGVLAVGADLSAALKNAIRVEFLAEIYWKSCLIGEPILLTAEQLQQVRARSMGKRSTADRVETLVSSTNLAG